MKKRIDLEEGILKRAATEGLHGDEIAHLLNTAHFVYCIEVVGQHRVKIGVTGDPVHRLRGLRHQTIDELVLRSYFPGNVDDESAVHRQFATFRIRPNREWFWKAPEILRYMSDRMRTWSEDRWQQTDAAYRAAVPNDPVPSPSDWLLTYSTREILERN